MDTLVRRGIHGHGTAGCKVYDEPFRRCPVMVYLRTWVVNVPLVCIDVFHVFHDAGHGFTSVGVARNHTGHAQRHHDVFNNLSHDYASNVGSPNANVFAFDDSSLIFCNVNSGFVDNPAFSMDSACDITGLLPLAVIQ